MKKIPRTDNPLVVRTDFSDVPAWKAICAAIQEPVGEFGFRAYTDFLSDPGYEGLSSEQLRSLIPDRYDHPIVFIVDRTSLSHPEHPILVLDLDEEPGRTFRVVPSEMWAVENNLSTVNMSFREFADEVDQDGIFRG